MTSAGASNNASVEGRGEDWFSKVFHANPVPATLTTHPGGVFIDVNETFLRTFEYQLDEVVGKTAADLMVVVLNATPVLRNDYRIGVPQPGFYVEALNTDSAVYAGSNAGNLGGVRAEAIPHMGRPYSVSVTVPPLAGVFLKWTPAP